MSLTSIFTDQEKFMNHIRAYFLCRKAKAMMRNAEVEEKRMKEANANIQYFHKQAMLLNNEAMSLISK